LDTIGLSGKYTVIMHWYSGGTRVHQKMIENGYYFSFNYKMLSTKKGADILSRTPLSRVLLESDGPFADIKGNIYVPYLMKATVLIMSEILDVNEKDLQIILHNNFKNILNR